MATPPLLPPGTAVQDCGGGGNCFWAVLVAALRLPSTQSLRTYVSRYMLDADWDNMYALITADPGAREFAHWLEPYHRACGDHVRFRDLGRQWLQRDRLDSDPCSAQAAFRILRVDVVVTTVHADRTFTLYDVGRGTARHPRHRIIWLAFHEASEHWQLMRWRGAATFARVADLPPELRDEIRQRNPSFRDDGP